MAITTDHQSIDKDEEHAVAKDMARSSMLGQKSATRRACDCVVDWRDDSAEVRRGVCSEEVSGCEWVKGPNG